MLSRVSAVSPAAIARPRFTPSPIRFGTQYHLPHADLFCPADKSGASPFSLGKPLQTAALDTLRQFATPTRTWTARFKPTPEASDHVVTIMPNSRQAQKALGLSALPVSNGYIVHVQTHAGPESQSHTVITDAQLNVTSFHVQSNAQNPSIIKKGDLAQRKAKTAQVFQSVIHLLSHPQSRS